MLRFLADESCDYAVVRALTSLGHEVLPVAEAPSAAAEWSVLVLAPSAEDDRIEPARAAVAF